MKILKYNKGNCAGKDSGDYDLGTLEYHPVMVSAANVVDKIIDLQAVLDENGINSFVDNIVYDLYAPLGFLPLIKQAGFRSLPAKGIGPFEIHITNEYGKNRVLASKTINGKVIWAELIWERKG